MDLVDAVTMLRVSEIKSVATEAVYPVYAVNFSTHDSTQSMWPTCSLNLISFKAVGLDLFVDLQESKLHVFSLHPFI